MTVQIDKVIALNINIDDWDKYIGYMGFDYRDIWINHYDLEGNEYIDCDFNGLLETCEEFKKAKYFLNEGKIVFIVLRADID